jgi:ABC-type phosphate transport system auxiliary subunit
LRQLEAEYKRNMDMMRETIRAQDLEESKVRRMQELRDGEVRRLDSQTDAARENMSRERRQLMQDLQRTAPGETQSISNELQRRLDELQREMESIRSRQGR